MGGGGFTITEHDPAHYTDEEIALAVELGNAINEEVLPGEPPTPVDVGIANSRSVPARMRRFGFRAWAPDGTLVGAVSSYLDPEHDDNPDVIDGHITVRRDYRRKGVGLGLLAHVVALARQENRIRIMSYTLDPVPAGAAFAAAMGAEPKAAVHVNHLPTAEIDRALMEKWVADGPGRAPGYELVHWDGRTPDRYIEPFVDLALVMNDAPRDDLQLNDFTMTTAEWREFEDQMDAVGTEHWTIVARRVNDGALAGFHDVNWAPHEPNTVYVGATGVRPEHRGHALGKWLKAAMTLRVVAERPDVTDIRTENNDSNDAMLGINREMGYRPLIGTSAWELDVDTAAARLAERGIEIPTLTPR
jgi:mycothiol synthase